MKIRVIQPVSNFKLGEVVELEEQRALNAIKAGLAEEVKEKKETKKAKTL